MRHLISSFRRHEKGNFAIVGAILAPMLTTTSLAAVDLARMAQQGTELQSAADAAAFNLAKVDDGTASDGSLRQITSNFVKANMSPNLRDKIAVECAGTLTECDSGAAKRLSGELDSKREFHFVEATLDFHSFGLFPVGDSIRRFSVVEGGGAGTSGPVCILALETGGAEAVGKSGSSSITAPGCNIVANSVSPQSIRVTGSGSMTLNCIVTAGGYSRSGSGEDTFECDEPLTNRPPTADPHADLKIPNTVDIPERASSESLKLSGSADQTGESGSYAEVFLNTSGEVVLGGGNYYVGKDFSIKGSGDVSVGAGNHYIQNNFSISGSGDVSLGDGDRYIGGDFSISGSGRTTLGSGIYYIGGKLSISGSGDVVGDGVVFVLLEGASMSHTGSGTLRLTAPTDADAYYKGFVVVQARGNDNKWKTAGSGGLELDGIVYAPSAPIDFAGSGGAEARCVRFIGATVDITGSGGIKGEGCQEALANRDLFLSGRPLVLVR